MRAVAARFGLSVSLHYGWVEKVDPADDIVLLAHSLVGPDFAARSFRAIRAVRDPRDIWVSAYLYHRHCSEDWCTNTNFDPSAPIIYPRVDYSFEHYLESWKRAYLARLGGRSYQCNLLDRDREAGLAFELAGYTGCTLDAMCGWRLAAPDLLPVQLEAVMRDFDGTLGAIFRHLGFSQDECEEAVALARPHDIARMSDAAIARHPHIHSRTLSKWRDFLSSGQLSAFEQRYGGLITDLGYRLSKQGGCDARERALQKGRGDAAPADGRGRGRALGA
jgi:transposase-like protein